MDDLKLKFVSYNCRGYNTSKRNYVNKLLRGCSFLLMQEHWLADDQLVMLNDISADHLTHAVCGFDNREVLAGRPYGGCCIFWCKNLNVNVNIVPLVSRRICALIIETAELKLLIINVYMPYEAGDTKADEFTEQLFTIETIVDDNPECHVVLIGDFNVDFARSSLHNSILSSFCKTNSLYSVTDHSQYNVDFTYHFGFTRFNTLDQCIVSGTIFDKAIDRVYCSHDVDNLSDHEPLTVEMTLPISFFMSETKEVVSRPAWYKAKTEHLVQYKELLSNKLHDIVIPTDALLCDNNQCCNLTHRTALNKYMNDITACCLTSAKCTILCTKSHNTCASHETVLGWSEYVEPIRSKAVFWHEMWLSCGLLLMLCANVVLHTIMQYEG